MKRNADFIYLSLFPCVAEKFAELCGQKLSVKELEALHASIGNEWYCREKIRLKLKLCYVCEKHCIGKVWLKKSFHTSIGNTENFWTKNFWIQKFSVYVRPILVWMKFLTKFQRSATSQCWENSIFDFQRFTTGIFGLPLDWSRMDPGPKPLCQKSYTMDRLDWW